MIPSPIPTEQATIVEIKVGKIMSAGLELPAAALRPIVVVGISCIEQALIIISIIIEEFAIPEPSSNPRIAFIP